jgi:hypothetical protein
VLEPDITVTEPSAFGTTAAHRAQPPGTICGPVDVQNVSVTLTVIVPDGVTVHDWVAVPPETVVAVSVKLFATRDCAAAGVQLTVLPLSVAPAGAAVSENITAPPAGSVAVT